jgi:hypothetical protein
LAKWIQEITMASLKEEEITCQEEPTEAHPKWTSFHSLGT